MWVLGPKFSKMTAPNFWSNSLCGASTVFKENCQTKGGTPQKPPRRQNLYQRHPFEAKVAILKFKMAILNAKIAKHSQMQVLGVVFSKITAANFRLNSLCGRGPFNRERGQTRGGSTRPPKKDTICSIDSLFKPKKKHFEAKNGQPEAKIANIRHLDT